MPCSVYNRLVKRDLSRRVMDLSIRGKISLVWRSFRDPDVPVFAKAVLPLVVAYVALPFDIVPDRVPILGQIDDLVIVAAGMTLFVALTPRHVLEYHLSELE
jgi:uncharacterized membrane protein YkvA (DUF1232 family)